LGTLRMTLGRLAVFPPSTRQEATSVAPFQLAYTVVLDPVLKAVIAGDMAGVPRHCRRYTR
jgi:hypothetical protein